MTHPHSSRATKALYTVTSLASAVFCMSSVACGLDCREYDSCGEYGSSGRSPGGAAGTTSSNDGGALIAGAAGASSAGAMTAAGSSGADTGGTRGTDGADGGDGAGGTDGSCESPACWTDALFVAVGGNDDDAGTPDAPLATLTHAIARASKEGKRVIACQQTFTENVVLSPDAQAKLEGGYDCVNGWAPGSGRTLVRPSSGVPLTIRDVEGLLEIQNFEFEARSGTAFGESSIGAVVVRSTNVVFKRVRIAAGDGHDGADGVTAPYEELAEFASDGLEASGNFSGGDGAVCWCPCVGAECPEPELLLTVGGDGGDGGAGVEDTGGDPGRPASESGGKGGIKGADCTEGGGGGRGADADAVANGLGATMHGVLTDDAEWQPASGSPGNDGKVAQGGGGGRASEYGGGGGGACGGCGGKGGAPGGGGGSSFGIVAVDSNIALIETLIQTGDGGDGGDGAPGQPGQMGGSGGDGARFACNGGDGGTGSHGALGGSGAGGLSVGVLYRGRAPNGIDETQFRPGRSGSGGGGDSAGIDGDVQSHLEQ